MHGHASFRKTRSRVLGILAAAALLLVAAWWVHQRPPVPPAPPETAPAKVRVPVTPPPVIDYQTLDGDAAAQALMDQRRQQLGLKEGLDMIVGREEKVRIGDKTLSMAEIERLIAIREGRVVENPLGDPGASPSASASGLYGIHVVRPGENIWNIHFRLLQDYLGQKGIFLSRHADEPRSNGSSSGVGRLLKFSEHMVYIYNLSEGRLDDDITVIRPLSKIVIYSMDRVLALLEGIDYRRIDQIRFDGEILWLPASQ